MRLRSHALTGGAATGAATQGSTAAISGRRLRRGLADALAALVPPALVALLYGSATRLFWLSDDFYNLRYVRDWRPAQYCLDPEVWQRLPFRMLTPLVFVSYDLDLATFGWAPRGFYLHELAALAAAGVALHALLRFYLPVGWSVLGAMLFVLGAPIAAAVAPMLMGRHYAEAMLFVLLAAVAWIAGLRARAPATGWALAVGSACLWLLAALAKEVAIPFVALLPFFLPAGPPDKALRRLLPHAVALLVYSAYRRYLVGAWFGGYGWAVEGTDRLKGFALLPGRLLREMAGGSSPWGWGMVAAMLCCCLGLAVKSRRAAAILAVAAAAVVLPIFPVAAEVVARYAVAPWLALVVAFVIAAPRVRFGRWLAMAALVFAVVANRQAWARQLGSLERQSVENRALMSLGRGDVVRLPSGPPASLEELHRLTSELMHRESGTWYLDEIYLCAGASQPRRLWEYDAAEGRVVDVTSRLPALRRAHCDGIRGEAPLAASFRYDDAGVLHWSLGPWKDGVWSIVLRDGVDSYPVPAQAAFRLGLSGAFPLRVRYQSPAGWTTYSPVLRLDLAPGGRWAWRRPTTPPRGSS